MITLKKKPIYKVFLSLRTNVQYRKRLRLLKFKKQKWQKFISLLTRLNNRRKKKFFIYDLNKYVISKFSNSFKRKYKIVLQNKKKVNLFYGSLSKAHLKKQKNILFKKKGSRKNKFDRNLLFVELFETRLDVVLYRSHFVTSVTEARQLILHKNVKVNNKIITKSSYVTTPGDIISIDHNLHKLILKNIYGSHFWPIPPKYLDINYKTFEICFLNKVRNYNIVNLFPFPLNLHHTLKSFFSSSTGRACGC